MFKHILQVIAVTILLILITIFIKAHADSDMTKYGLKVTVQKGVTFCTTKGFAEILDLYHQDSDEQGLWWIYRSGHCEDFLQPFKGLLTDKPGPYSELIVKFYHKYHYVYIRDDANYTIGW